ncbi:uncharacterized protein LOC143024488 [Oratosquilla oratoria]|uniref:uncharacterized protein LOC143024488 n=1 Tax=Oratosquilla oratoria TaxID=337810 RepID=UPI003F7714DF
MFFLSFTKESIYNEKVKPNQTKKGQWETEQRKRNVQRKCCEQRQWCKKIHNKSKTQRQVPQARGKHARHALTKKSDGYFSPRKSASQLAAIWARHGTPPGIIFFAFCGLEWLRMWSSRLLQRDSPSLLQTGSTILKVLLLLMPFVVAPVTTLDPDDIPGGLENSPLSEIQAVEGNRVRLPCDITPPKTSDRLILMLVYYGKMGTPLYSLDARGSSVEQAIHWSDENHLGHRALFDPIGKPSGLVIEKVRLADAGEYRCRVDFLTSPTRNVRVHLKVVVPPRQIAVTAVDVKGTRESGRPRGPTTSGAYSGGGGGGLLEGRRVSGVIGPYPVGSDVSLSCQVTGGVPRPKVTWWHEGSLLDDLSEVMTGPVTRNTLTLTSLSHRDLFRVLTCQASNSNMTIPLAASVTIDVAFPPTEIRILSGGSQALSAGKRYSIVCEAYGSRPPAILSWWRHEGDLLTNTKDQILNDGNITRSTLMFVPDRQDNGQILTCRANNTAIPEMLPMHDSLQLQIYYAPHMELNVGAAIDIHNIEEGSDVYFICEAISNPPPYRLRWLHNGVEMVSKAQDGILVQGNQLVLQRVNRWSSGLYACEATNIEGTTQSNAVTLNVKFVPECAPNNSGKVYYARRHQEILVTCLVDAYPETKSFRWAFNNTAETVDIAETYYVVSRSSRSRSVLRFTPMTRFDFGSLLCWSVSDVGMQRQPCVFHVLPATAPDPVTNCSVWQNSTSEWDLVVEVECEAGWDGGLNQTFSLEVLEGDAVRATFEGQTKPEFAVRGLKAKVDYTFAVTAINDEGRSSNTYITYSPPLGTVEGRASAARASSSSSSSFPSTSSSSPASSTSSSYAGKGVLMTITPILAVLLGVVASLVISSVVLVIVVRSRRRRRQGAPPGNGAGTTDTGVGTGTGGKASGAKILYTGPLREDEMTAFSLKQQPQGPDIVCINKDCEKEELMRKYMTQQDTSFYVNPGTLLNNAGTETDALLPHVTPITLTATTTSLVQTPSTLATLAPLTASDSLSRLSGRTTPSSRSLSSGRGSSITVAYNPEYYSGVVPGMGMGTGVMGAGVMGPPGMVPPPNVVPGGIMGTGDIAGVMGAGGMLEGGVSSGVMGGVGGVGMGVGGSMGGATAGVAGGGGGGGGGGGLGMRVRENTSVPLACGTLPKESSV